MAEFAGRFLRSHIAAPSDVAHRAERDQIRRELVEGIDRGVIEHVRKVINKAAGLAPEGSILSNYAKRYPTEDFTPEDAVNLALLAGPKAVKLGGQATKTAYLRGIGLGDIRAHRGTLYSTTKVPMLEYDVNPIKTYSKSQGETVTTKMVADDLADYIKRNPDADLRLYATPNGLHVYDASPKAWETAKKGVQEVFHERFTNPAERANIGHWDLLHQMYSMGRGKGKAWGTRVGPKTEETLSTSPQAHTAAGVPADPFSTPAPTPSSPLLPHVPAAANDLFGNYPPSRGGSNLGLDLGGDIPPGVRGGDFVELPLMRMRGPEARAIGAIPAELNLLTSQLRQKRILNKIFDTPSRRLEAVKRGSWMVNEPTGLVGLSSYEGKSLIQQLSTAAPEVMGELALQQRLGEFFPGWGANKGLTGKEGWLNNLTGGLAQKAIGRVATNIRSVGSVAESTRTLSVPEAIKAVATDEPPWMPSGTQGGGLLYDAQDVPWRMAFGLKSSPKRLGWNTGDNSGFIPERIFSFDEPNRTMTLKLEDQPAAMRYYDNMLNSQISYLKQEMNAIKSPNITPAERALKLKEMREWVGNAVVDDLMGHHTNKVAYTPDKGYTWEMTDRWDAGWNPGEVIPNLNKALETTAVERLRTKFGVNSRLSQTYRQYFGSAGRRPSATPLSTLIQRPLSEEVMSPWTVKVSYPMGRLPRFTDELSQFLAW